MILFLVGTLLVAGGVGCHAFRHKHSSAEPKRVHADTTVEGWVGGERPSF